MNSNGSKNGSGGSGDHARAISLLIEAQDGLTPSDTGWLQSHLEGCHECAAYAEAQRRLGGVLRTASEAASPRLVMATQSRLRAMATQMQERRTRNHLLAVALFLGVVTSLATMAAIWFVVEWWLGDIDLARIAVNEGAVWLWVLWMLPASLIAAFLLMIRREATQDSRSVIGVRAGGDYV